MDFFTQTGKLALGSRLRRLGERFLTEAEKINALYEIELHPRWFPVFYVLSEHEGLSTTEIAGIIGQSHASVSQVVKEMKKKGLIATVKSKTDGRTNAISLSPAGKALIPLTREEYQDVTDAVEALLAETQYDLWKAMEEMEFMLDRQDFYSRVRQVRKARESREVEIIDYQPEHREAFSQINYAWIEKYFEIEASDRKSLDHPETYILEPGGHIFIAKYKGEIVGVCALIKKDDETLELAKMGVIPAAQGKHVGWLLARACIDKAKKLGAKKLYLESNTKLKPAIKLYYKLGFEKITGPPSPYARSNIQMEMRLS